MPERAAASAPVRRQNWLDRLGALAGAACAVHCLLTGVALALLSSLGLGAFGNLWIDIGFLAIALVVGSIALWHGAKRHRSIIPALFYVAGLVLVITAHFEEFSHWGAVHEEHRHTVMTTILSIAGGVCFVTFHLLNSRLGKCSCPH